MHSQQQHQHRMNNPSGSNTMPPVGSTPNPYMSMNQSTIPPGGESTINCPPTPNTIPQQIPNQQQQQSKELNAATLCRFGQETVHEIIARMLDVFGTFKTIQPPDGKAVVDKKAKFQETLRNIRANFKRLRVIYEKIEDSFPTKPENCLENREKLEYSLVNAEEKKNTEAYRLAMEEYKEIMDQVMLRNRHLKDTIDHLRQIIWDVNTMLAMRKE